MNLETFLWVLAYAVVGLVVLSITAAVIAGAVKSVHPDKTYAVTVEADDGVTIKAVVNTEPEVLALVNTLSPGTLKPGGFKPGGPVR